MVQTLLGILCLETGKAVARAVRAHCMVEAAVTVMLLKMVLSTGAFSQDLSDLLAFYNYLLNNGFDDNMAFPAALKDRHCKEVSYRYIKVLAAVFVLCIYT